ncbi:MAG: hypothetical protein V5B32_12120 [Candidatus Accumulibacter sp. UW26]|jgi:hypothetical protein
MASRRFLAVASANTRRSRLFDDGSHALFAGQRPGIVEPPVQMFHNGLRVGSPKARFNALETYDRVSGTRSYPLTAVNLVANFHYRLTYQQANGGSAPLGTSVIVTPSYRTENGLCLIPAASHCELVTGAAERYQVVSRGLFASGAQVTSRSAFPAPVVGESRAMLTIGFAAPAGIRLAGGAPFVGNDRFRLLTLSSMFSSATVFDANLLRYEGADGVIRTFALKDATPRAAHLFPRPVALGSWFELIKTPGSTWFPDSPSLRVAIVDAAGLRLGLQGFLAATKNANHDSLSVWLEWPAAPAVISAATVFTARYILTCGKGAAAGTLAAVRALTATTP